MRSSAALLAATAVGFSVPTHGGYYSGTGQKLRPVVIPAEIGGTQKKRSKARRKVAAAKQWRRK